MKKLLVLFAAIALIGAFALPAAAGDWSFYGSSRMATFMEDYDKDAGDDSDVSWKMPGNARIGAKVASGDISGRFEYGTTNNVRLLWAEWDYGGGSLGLGQNYTPCNLWTSAQAYGPGGNNLLDIGGVYGGRQQMIMLSMAGLKVAAINPSTTEPVGGDVDTTIPKVEVSWSKSFGPGSVQLIAGYNSIDVETAAKTYGVDSMVVGVLGTASFGAAYVNANVFTATNYTNYGLASWENAAAAGAGSAALVGNDIKDADSLGFILVAGFKASETMNLEFGIGSVEHEPDGAKQGDDTLAYYVQASIALADGFFIVPEIGGYDFGEDSTGAKEGGMTYFGAKWQMNF